MTIEELLDCSANKLAAMSDEELLEYFTPYLNCTRPELAKLQKSTSPKRTSRKSDVDDMEDVAKRLASQFGVTLNI